MAMNNTTRPVTREESNTPTPVTTPTTDNRNDTAERPAETATAPTTPARRTREKARPIEVLTAPNTSVKSMSDKEKTLLIEHYKAENNKLIQQVDAYRHNAEEAYKKAQLFENTANDIMAQDSAKFNDIVQAVSMLYKTVFLIVKDGTNND